jgi:hypothetical protein
MRGKWAEGERGRGIFISLLCVLGAWMAVLKIGAIGWG